MARPSSPSSASAPLNAGLRPLRPGMTLVELLTVIAVLSTLLGLLVPAVQSARETANRAACQNNLRQLGLALHQFHDAHLVLPASGWTMAGPGNRRGKFVGWRALSLPYLEQANLQQQYDYGSHWWEGRNPSVGTLRLRVHECPSVAQRKEVTAAPAKPPRPAMSFPAALASSDYEAIMGVQPTVGALYAEAALSRSAMFRNSAISLTAVTDGTSHTILLVECAARPLVFRGRTPRPGLSNDQCQGWIDSESAFSLDGASHDGSLQGRGPTLTPRAINATNENEPYSFHPGGANFLFADGHATFLPDSVALEVFAALCTRAGGEAVTAGSF